MTLKQGSITVGLGEEMRRQKPRWDMVTLVLQSGHFAAEIFHFATTIYLHLS